MTNKQKMIQIYDKQNAISLPLLVKVQKSLNMFSVNVKCIPANQIQLFMINDNTYADLNQTEQGTTASYIYETFHKYMSTFILSKNILPDSHSFLNTQLKIQHP